MNEGFCVQVYTRKNLLSKVINVAWSTGTYQGNRERSLMGHELFAQVQPVFLILLIMSSIPPGEVLTRVESHRGEAAE